MSPKLSILIKALNEERRIEACLAAAVAEATPLGGEVILVDSCSTDRTVELARKFPVRIVQFASAADRGCAAAVQLGYQFAAASDYVYVLDADMVLQPGFLANALATMRSDPEIAGVGGKVLDRQVRTAYDLRRRAAAEQQNRPLDVSELGGGGLYRLSAIREIGYLAHRGLAAYEEAELGARLTSYGWRLVRLATPAVIHDGHRESNITMLIRLWRNGRASAGGALLRSAVGHRWFWRILWKLRHHFFMPMAHLLSVVTATALSAQLPFVVTWLLFWLVVLVGLIVRKKSLRGGLWVLLESNYFSFFLVFGFFARPTAPSDPIQGIEL